MRTRLVLLCALLITLATPSVAEARAVVSKSEYRGIQLLAVELPPKGSQDVEMIGIEAALANIRAAIDAIYARSRFSAERIERLKKNGRVTLVYDAAFPPAKMASAIIAAFFPDYFQPEQGGRKEFLVAVSRYGVKWPTDKLAAVIVHELVGHGLQHLNGRTGRDRKIDKECEALIYEERAYQDFSVRRDTSDMQRFRADTKNNWCADFRRHLTRKGFNADRVWNFGKPDVPKLLVHFENYINALRESGVAGDAVAAAEQKRQNKFEAMVAMAEGGSTRDMFTVGSRYLRGLGVERDTARGISWIRKAADHGHAQAQYFLGVLYAGGHNVAKDPIEAYKWLSLSAERGYPRAKPAKRKLEAGLSAAQLADAERRIRAWQPAKSGG